MLDFLRAALIDIRGLKMNKDIYFKIAIFVFQIAIAIINLLI